MICSGVGFWRRRLDWEMEDAHWSGKRVALQAAAISGGRVWWAAEEKCRGRKKRRRREGIVGFEI